MAAFREVLAVMLQGTEGLKTVSICAILLKAALKGRILTGREVCEETLHSGQALDRAGSMTLEIIVKLIIVVHLCIFGYKEIVKGANIGQLVFLFTKLFILYLHIKK